MILLLVTSMTVSCAKKAADIKPSYVPPTYYKNHTCDELIDELFRVNAEINALAAEVDSHARKDKVKTGAGILLFWPTLFFLKGDSREAAEYSRMLGEKEAIEFMGRQKGCALTR